MRTRCVTWRAACACVGLTLAAAGGVAWANGKHKPKGPVIPPELAVGALDPSEQGEPTSPGPGELRAVKLLPVTKLGGQTVVVWEEKRRWRLKDEDGRKYNRDSTFVGVATAGAVGDGRHLYVEVEHSSDVKSPEAGTYKIAFAFTYSWQDLDGDAEPELVLARKKGDVEAERIYQVRHGALLAVPREAATCKRDKTKLTAVVAEGEAEATVAGNAQTTATRKARIAAVKTGDATATRCALVDYLLAWPPAGGRGGVQTPMPRAGSPMLFPGGAKGTVLFLDRDYQVARLRVTGEEVDIEPLQLTTKPPADDLAEGDPDAELIMGPDALPDWADLVLADGRAFFVADVTNVKVDEYGPAEKNPYKRRDLYIVEVDSNETRVVEPLLVNKKGLKLDRSFTWKDGDGDGVPELMVKPKKGKKGAVTWRWDAAAKAWAKAP